MLRQNLLRHGTSSGIALQFEERVLLAAATPGATTPDEGSEKDKSAEEKNDNGAQPGDQANPKTPNSGANTNGANTNGANTNGANTNDGNTNGANTNGGSTNGGSTNGGSTNGGNTNGANTNDGNTNDGNTNDGNTNGANTNGANTNGANTNGGSTNGGNTNGANTNGANTNGGSTNGANTNGSNATAKEPLNEALKNTKFKSVNAKYKGSADATGKVEVGKAPDTNGSADNLLKKLEQGGAKSQFLKDNLAESNTRKYGNEIAGTDAAKEVSNKLAARPNTFTKKDGETLINSAESLKNNYEALAKGGNFLFQGNINVKDHIKIGSNSKIRIDGKLKWTGADANVEVPDPTYSPGGEKPGGFFEVNYSKNVSITGSKRSLIDGNGGRQNGISIKGSDNVSISGLNMQGNYNSIQTVDGKDSDGKQLGNSNITIKENYIKDSQRRAVHTKLSTNGVIKNNLFENSKQDGVDLDAVTTKFNVSKNLSVGVQDRHHFWNEIYSSNNTFDGNVAVHGPKQGGGIHENGSELSQGKPTKNNTYSNNHVFYANKDQFAGVSIYNNKNFFGEGANERLIDRDSITVKNNYVWLNSNDYGLSLDDPKKNLDDVRYLTPNEPVA